MCYLEGEKAAFPRKHFSLSIKGSKEGAALTSCYSVLCHESQSCNVCSVPQPNLHTPTINLLPGNPLPLTCFCVCSSVCRVCVVLTLSGRDSARELEEKIDLARNKIFKLKSNQILYLYCVC